MESLLLEVVEAVRQLGGAVSLDVFVAEQGLGRTIANHLRAICRNRIAAELLGARFEATEADVVARWAESVAADPELALSPLLASLQHARAAVREAAVVRVLHGPLFDALHCLPLCFDDHRIERRRSMLLWEAGGRGMVLPALGRWVWSNERALETLVLVPAMQNVGSRVVAARTLSVFADGFVEEAAPGRALQVIATLRSLIDHPEPLVWAPATRAIGRMAAHSYSARTVITQAIASARQRRWVAAVASMGRDARGEELESEVKRWFTASNDQWTLAAFAVGAPHLAREQPKSWNKLCELTATAGHLELAWSLASGLATLGRHGGLAPHETRAARALRDRLAATPQAGAHEEARRIETLANLGIVLDEPGAPTSCFEQYDRAIGALCEGEPIDPLPDPRLAFDDALSKLSATDVTARARALLAIRGATRTHAMRLPELVLGTPTDERDTEHLFSRCEALLARESADFAIRTVAVNVLCDLVGARDHADGHGRAAARALTAIATSRWMRDLSDKPAAQESMRRSRKHFEDLFAVCLSQHPELQVADGVSAELAAWWTLCIGNERLLVPLHRDSATAQSLDTRLAAVQRALASAASEPVARWRPTFEAAMNALEIEGTTMFDVVRRLLAALADAERAPVDHDDAISQLADLCATCEAMLSIAHDLDEAFVRGTVFRGEAAVTRQFTAARQRPWTMLVGSLRRVVEPIAERCEQRARDIEPFHARPGARLGPYELVLQLGRGGMGEVWQARGPQGIVALKIPYAKDPVVLGGLAERMRLEAETLRKLQFNQVALLFDSGVIRNVPFMAVEYIRGRTLQEHFIEDIQADPARRHLGILRGIVDGICKGLYNLHRAGFVHRDLKPANIMLRMRDYDPAPLLAITNDPDGLEIDDTMLLDFGISHTFDTRGNGFTPGYSAPELFCGGLVGPEADLYSLGATLFDVFAKQCLVGKMPTEQAIHWHLEQDISDHRLQSHLNAIPQPYQTIIEGTVRLEPSHRMPLAQIRALLRS